jgi:ribonucleoside-diphosphate reductase beta chain
MSVKYRKILDQSGDEVNQIIDAVRSYPIELWHNGCANDWRPRSVSMNDDATQWKTGVITDEEKNIVERAMGLFSAGESEVNNNIFLCEYLYIKDGSCRQFLTRKAFEESLHNDTVAVCCETFMLDEKTVAEAYKNVPSVKAKSDFLLKNTSDIFKNKDFDITTIEGKREFVKNLVCYYVICEGIFFWTSFVLLASIFKQGKLIGLHSQIKYTLKDETNHLNFGIWLLNEIKKDYPEVFTKQFQKSIIDLINEAIELESDYARDVIPEPMMGLSSDMVVQFVNYIGNRRFEAIGLDYKLPTDENPFPWISEVLEGKDMAAFFETKETNYRKSDVLDDDFDF